MTTYQPGQQVQVRIRDRSGRSRGWREGEVCGCWLDADETLPDGMAACVRVGNIRERYPASDLRPARAKPAKKRKAAPRKRKARVTDSRWSAYLDFVRGKPCAWSCFSAHKCVGHAEPPHHEPPRGRHNNGHDLRTVKLCTSAHRERHSTGSIDPCDARSTLEHIHEWQIATLVEWLEHGDTVREGVG